MGYRPGDPYVKEFVTCTGAGAAVNADSLPVATANHNGTDDGSFTLTVANLDTGRYKITGTVPTGYAGGNVVGVSVAATIGGIATKAIVDTFVLDRLPALNVDTASGITVALLDTTGAQYLQAASTITVTREIAGSGGGTTPAAGTVTRIGTTNRYRFAGTAADFNGTDIAFTFAGSGGGKTVQPQTYSVNTSP